MAVPKFKYFIRPTLELHTDGKARYWKEVEDEVSAGLGLTAEDREELLPSGQQNRVANRIQWALTYLRKAGLIESAGRGINQITDSGREYLGRAPEVISPTDLKEFSEFEELLVGNRDKGEKDDESELRDETPEEAMAAAYTEHVAALASPLLDPPPGYYDGTEGLTGDDLRDALHEIIDDHAFFPYSSPTLGS